MKRTGLRRLRLLGRDPVGESALRLDDLAQPIAEQLRRSFATSPLTVAIQAPRGRGKTTVMRRLRVLLEEAGCLAVWFEPWRYRTRSDVWKGLLYTIGDEVARRRRAEPRRAGWASLASVLPPKGGALEELLESLEGQPWSVEHQHEMRAALAELVVEPGSSGGSRPLVLLVDDLDRCEPEPAVAAVEALHWLPGQPGLASVVGVTVEHLAGEGSADARASSGLAAVLSESVDVPYQLPQLAPERYDAYLESCLQESGVDHLLKPDEWRTLFAEACYPDLRAAKRLINRFVTTVERELPASSWTGRAREHRRVSGRVAFVLLLSWRFPDFFAYLRKRALVVPDLLFRYQLFFLDPELASRESPELLLAEDGQRAEVERESVPLPRFGEEDALRSFFRRCLLPATPGTEPLVPPFAAEEPAWRLPGLAGAGPAGELHRALGLAWTRVEGVPAAGAERALRLALAMARDRGSLPGEYLALRAAAGDAQRRGDFDEAGRRLEQALAVAGTQHEWRAQVACHVAIGENHRLAKRREEGLQQIETQAIPLLKTRRDPLTSRPVFEERRRLLEDLGKSEEAVKARREADSLTAEIGDARIFVSYSSEERAYMEELIEALRPLERLNVDLWVDTRLKAADRWDDEIVRALEAATAALLLISPNFLRSEYIREKELPTIFQGARDRGLKVLWVLVDDCNWEDHWFRRYQSLSKVKGELKALNEMTPPERAVELKRIHEEIRRSLAAD